MGRSSWLLQYGNIDHKKYLKNYFHKKLLYDYCFYRAKFRHPHITSQKDLLPPLGCKRLNFFATPSVTFYLLEMLDFCHDYLDFNNLKMRAGKEIQTTVRDARRVENWWSQAKTMQVPRARYWPIAETIKYHRAQAKI